MQQLVLFASGKGSNAAAIIDHFERDPEINVALIVSNKPRAGVLELAARKNIPVHLIDKASWQEGGECLTRIEAINPSLIVLAGFLWKIPDIYIQRFPERIINLHPALLPKYGGKGMYGNFVHEAVLQARDPASGLTIHYVNAHYDSGDIILQAHCPLQIGDTADTLANRIHQLEHFYYPRVIEFLLKRH